METKGKKKRRVKAGVIMENCGDCEYVKKEIKHYPSMDGEITICKKYNKQLYYYYGDDGCCKKCKECENRFADFTENPLRKAPFKTFSSFKRERGMHWTGKKFPLSFQNISFSYRWREGMKKNGKRE